MGLVLWTGPLLEPVSMEEARAHLRVDSGLEGSVIESLLVAAREHVEGHCRRALITQTWDLFLDAWPSGDMLRLPLPRLQSVTSVQAHYADGTTDTVDDESYVVDSASEPGRIALVKGASWPSAELRVVNGVQIRFVAGYGDEAADVPQQVRQAILLLVGALYENREEIVVSQGVNIGALPFGAWALLRKHRVIRFPNGAI